MPKTKWMYPKIAKHPEIAKCFRLGLIIILSLQIMVIVYDNYLSGQNDAPMQYNTNVTIGCLLPRYNAYDAAVDNYFHHPQAVRCNDKPDVVFVDNDGLLQLNTSAASYYGNTENIKCSYQLVLRIGGDDKVNFSASVKLSFPAQIPGDAFLLECFGQSGTSFYKRVHQFVHVNSTFGRELLAESEDNPSVLLFGLDSLSREFAYRVLNKSVHYLTQELGAVVLKGYTVTGGNTFPNIIPLLTGKMAYTNELPKIDFSKDCFDPYPLLWKNFSKSGYATMFAEDFPPFAIFNYLAKGFCHPPTDYYLRPYFLATHQMRKVQSAYPHCYENKITHQLVLESYKLFLPRYKDKAKFVLSWVTALGHDGINNFKLADEDFYQFLKWLKEGDYLRNTVLVFFGDHGQTRDGIRNTPMGRVEQRMPFFSLVLPPSIRHKHPELLTNLKHNVHALTSPFDVHETLVDILHKFQRKPVVFTPGQKLPRGISLFTRVPGTRTCNQSGIQEHFCQCHKKTLVSTSSNEVRKVAAFALSSVNTYLLDVRHLCFKLYLFQIKFAEKIEIRKSVKPNVWRIFDVFYRRTFPVIEDYLVVFETIPGHALMEASVRSRDQTKFELLGPISRTNTYGNQSSCITVKRLQPYCLCHNYNQS